MKANETHLRPHPFLLMLFLGTVLGSCASTATDDLEAKVRVFNVYRGNAEELPQEIEGCKYVGRTFASPPSIAASSATVSIGSADTQQLLEVIRSRAYRKGADTAFISFAPLSQNDTLRATVFLCGETEISEKIGVLVRSAGGGEISDRPADCVNEVEWPSDLSIPNVIKSVPPSGYLRGHSYYLHACLTAQIDESGDVTDVQVVRADNPDFGAACAAALKNWKFEPAKRGSTPVAVSYQIFMSSGG